MNEMDNKQVLMVIDFFDRVKKDIKKIVKKYKLKADYFDIDKLTINYINNCVKKVSVEMVAADYESLNLFEVE